MAGQRQHGWAGKRLRALYASNPLARAILFVPAGVRRKFIEFRFASAMQTAENARNRIADDVTLDMPEFGGKFLCSPRSHLFRRIVVHGGYEADVANLVRKHLDPQRDMIDVGANIGFFTILGASLMETGRVLAVEPSNEACARLKSNIAANALQDRIIVFHGAASAQTGKAPLHHIEGKEEYASLAPIIHPATGGDEAGQEIVATDTIDNLVAQHRLKPGLIKIDVEGAEELALKGASNTIATHRPVILCELASDLLHGFGSSPAAILSLIQSANYRIVDVVDPKRSPDSRTHGEILCLPL